MVRWLPRDLPAEAGAALEQSTPLGTVGLPPCPPVLGNTGSGVSESGHPWNGPP